MSMLPRYDTKTFYEIYENVDTFKEDYESYGLPTNMYVVNPDTQVVDKSNVETLFYLLLGKFANNPIGNFSED